MALFSSLSLLYLYLCLDFFYFAVFPSFISLRFQLNFSSPSVTSPLSVAYFSLLFCSLIFYPLFPSFCLMYLCLLFSSPYLLFFFLCYRSNFFPCLGFVICCAFLLSFRFRIVNALFLLFPGLCFPLLCFFFHLPFGLFCFPSPLQHCPLVSFPPVFPLPSTVTFF